MKDAIERFELEGAMYASRAAQEVCRPFVLLKPQMKRDGDKWCALYGGNLMEGVSGFGDKPDEASRDFDRNWETENAIKK